MLQIEFPTTLLTKVVAKSQVGATSFSEKQYWTILKSFEFRAETCIRKKVQPFPNKLPKVFAQIGYTLLRDHSLIFEEFLETYK